LNNLADIKSAGGVALRVRTQEDLIRLPNSQADISRKLGFELPPEPYLAKQQTARKLRAGYPGDLVLQGDRLWRSTDVFLDSQRADSIRVMPDMKGIVAHFNCVLPPAETRGTVEIVTSEGNVQLNYPIEVEVLDEGDIGSPGLSPPGSAPSTGPPISATANSGTEMVKTAITQTGTSPQSISNPTGASSTQQARSGGVEISGPATPMPILGTQTAMQGTQLTSGPLPPAPTPPPAGTVETSPPPAPAPTVGCQPVPPGTAQTNGLSPPTPNGSGQNSRMISKILNRCAWVAEYGWKAILKQELDITQEK
jgi:hypothetical protein